MSPVIVDAGLPLVRVEGYAPSLNFLGRACDLKDRRGVRIGPRGRERGSWGG